MILETAERFPLSTGESMVQFLSAEFLPADIISELTNLTIHGCLIEEPKDSGLGTKVFSYTLSEKGKKLLQELGN
jgi:DNA-binding PadR family transcriptional regulator